MKEIVDSVTKIIKNRLTNSLYGVFFFSWIAFHWSFVFSIFALDDIKILQITGLLKNEYLIQRYFNPSDFWFWFSWIMPFIVTYFIIWRLPKWILLKAYDKTEEYEIEKKIIKIKQQKRIEQEETKLQEQTVKKVAAVAKQVVEEKKIKNTDPNSAYHNFINSLYSGSKYIPNLNVDHVSYFDALGLINIVGNNVESLTEKGKYFALKVKERN